MSKSAASEGALGELHNTLATVLAAALKAEGGAPAAVLAVAAKFLKDNEISCVVSKGNAMEALDHAIKDATAPQASVEDPVLRDALDSVIDMDAYRNGTR